MNILIIGGQLQGVEIACLAKEAGWKVEIVDRKKAALASQLCDRFYCVDALELGEEFFCAYDLVFPATENLETLQGIKRITQAAGVPFAFDEAAFLLSRSKMQTNRFLQELNVNIPPLIGDYVLCNDGNNRGYIVKPDCSSGSKGVKRFSDRLAAHTYIKNNPDCFGQIFVDGPVLSIEASCKEGVVTPYLVTEVVVNSVYDCKRIVAPAPVSEEVKKEIEELAVEIGEALNMTGLFDLEMIYHHKHLFVLEVDARIPSQTPLASYYATGINLVVETARCFVELDAHKSRKEGAEPGHVTVLQHIRIQNGSIEFVGEGALSHSLPLHKLKDPLGLDLILLSEENNDGARYATLIATETNNFDTLHKLAEIATRIARQEIAHDEIIDRQYCLN